MVTLKSFMTEYIDQNFLEEAGEAGVSVNGEQQDHRVRRCAGTLNWFPVARLLLSFGVSCGDGWGRSCGWAGINPHLSERGQNKDCRYQPLTQIPAALAPQRVKAAVIWSGWGANVCHPAHPYLLLGDDSISSHICRLINTPAGQNRAPPRIDLQMVYTAEGGLCCFSAAVVLFIMGYLCWNSSWPLDKNTSTFVIFRLTVYCYK